MDPMLNFLTDATNWSGSDGVPHRLLEHLLYSLIPLIVAAAIAIPLGLYVGHTGRGRFAVVNITGAVRAIPSLGLLFVMVLFLGPRLSGDAAFLVPCYVVLTVLAIPPILAGTYAGIQEVDSAARDAAKGMGMRSLGVLFEVEFPCALPLIFSGLRAATLQVIATATIAATAGLGGFGRYLIDGLAVRDFGQMAAGAVLVAALALVIDLLFVVIQRYLISPGITGRRRQQPDTTVAASALGSPGTTPST